MATVVLGFNISTKQQYCCTIHFIKLTKVLILCACHCWLGCVHYLYSGEGLNDPDKVLLQKVVVKFGQVCVDDGIISQLFCVLSQRLHVWTCTRNKALSNEPWMASLNLPMYASAVLTFSKSANDLFLLACATHFSASVCYREGRKKRRKVHSLYTTNKPQTNHANLHMKQDLLVSRHNARPVCR